MASAEKYVFANTYKVIACDANDSLVVEAGSLKVAVSQAIIKIETQRKLKWISWDRKIWNLQSFGKFTHMLHEKEADVFYDQL